MTPAQRFATWLAPAMRRAGLDIDKQQGGGRVTLARACDVSRSTVTRWLEGQSMPSAEHFVPIAQAVGVPVRDLLVGAGVVEAADLNMEAAVMSVTPGMLLDQAARLLGVPLERVAAFRDAVEAMAIGFKATGRHEG